ncbi:MAG: DNA recombination protein RmuC [Candidatus Omnitrophota bacterium]
MQQQIDALRKQLSESLAQSSQGINQQLNELTSNISNNLNSMTHQMFSSQKLVGDRLDAAAQLVTQVQNDLGSLAKATQQVLEVGKEIASLDEILRAPKLRGGLGELFLTELLQKILPPSHFKLQHRFKSGDTVDAAINLGGRLVSVDSKFPLENFRRIVESGNDSERRKSRKSFIGDVKKHIDVIAAKYIVPDEGTFDFALMYIPAENVYYEIIIKDDTEQDQNLNSYALEKKVIPVSPNSLYAYLVTIILGLKGLTIEKNVQNIIQSLSRLCADVQHFKEDFDVLGVHIKNIKNKFDDADKKLSNFEDKLLNVCQFNNKKEEFLSDDKDRR